MSSRQERVKSRCVFFKWRIQIDTQALRISPQILLRRISLRNERRNDRFSKRHVLENLAWNHIRIDMADIHKIIGMTVNSMQLPQRNMSMQKR